MKKLKNSKGFTLMEMLIVVAIIAILVAIAIPTFTNQLEKAREATDMANLRSAYAEVMAAALSNTIDDGKTENGITHSGNTWSKDVTLTQKVDNWITKDLVVGGVTVGQAKAGATWTVKYDEANGSVTIGAKDNG